MAPLRQVFCDWGSSRLRAYLDVNGEILDRCEGPGIAGLVESPAHVLHDAIGGWRSAGPLQRIVLCGMVGSRNGMIEVPYVAAPVDAQLWADAGSVHVDGDLSMTVAAGVRGENLLGAPDVMRGEETQVFGAIALNAALGRERQWLLLPGTHSKWVQVDDGRITRFHTFITGELFALLRDQSSLLRTGDSADTAENGFSAGLERGRLNGLGASLFEVRSAQLVAGRTRPWARQFLSGVLIGAEIAALMNLGVVINTISVIGEPALAVMYQQALAAQGIAATLLDGDRCVIEGLRLLANRRKDPA